MTKRVGSYKKAIEWIAMNDETRLTDRFNAEVFEECSQLISVNLTADVFGRTPDRVAHDVLVYREKHGVV